MAQAFSITVGDTVRLKQQNMVGIVRFIGQIKSKNGIFYGIVLDDSYTGKNDGCYLDTRYFKCAPKKGLFVKRKSILHINIKRNKLTPRVTVGDTVHCIKQKCKGVIRFIGTPYSVKSRGVYYGIALNKRKGKNNGSVEGRWYFSCKDNYGIFTKAQGFTLQTQSNVSNHHTTPNKKHEPEYEYQVGDRVIIKPNRKGQIKWIGQDSTFGVGTYFGIRLTENRGDNDGEWKQKRYFKCPQGYGVYVPLRFVCRPIDDTFDFTNEEAKYEEEAQLRAQHYRVESQKLSLSRQWSHMSLSPLTLASLGSHSIPTPEKKILTALNSFDYVAFLNEIDNAEHGDDTLLLIFGFTRAIESTMYTTIPKAIKCFCADLYIKLYGKLKMSMSLNEIKWSDIRNDGEEDIKWIQTQPWLQTQRLKYNGIATLFTFCHRQGIDGLPGLLNDIYVEWRVKKHAAPLEIEQYLSKVFDNINDQSTELIPHVMASYSKMFSPRPIITPIFKIKDSLYEYIECTLIMSNMIHDITCDYKQPMQIDLWIIPKQIQSAMNTLQDDSDSDSDDDSDDEDDIETDCFIMNLRERLKLGNVEYDAFKGSLRDKDIQQQLREVLLHKITQNKTSNPRLVCIIDRRDKYHQFKPFKRHSMANNRYEKDIVIEIDFDSECVDKEYDEIYVYQPPDNYGVFSDRCCHEQQMHLSQSFMLPPVVIRHPNTGSYEICSGAHNDFGGQMFMISFCCQPNDNRMRWYINGWNMRITNPNNILKIWPYFFLNNDWCQNRKYMAGIKQELIDKWCLKIVNNRYKIYENSPANIGVRSKKK
eukprot:638186_1